MTSLSRSDWLVPASLVALSLVPVAAGIVRLSQLAGGAAVTAENARFFASPAPAVAHIFAVSLFCVLGAFQFAPGLRRRHGRWHRAAGRLLIPCGLAAGLSGLWMTQFYPNVGSDGQVLYGLRLLFGSAMVASIILSVAALGRRDFRQHGAWMTRAYAIGMGAGTQVLTQGPWMLLVGMPGVRSRAVLMGAGWVINLIVAEWIISRRLGDPTRATLTLVPVPSP